MYKLDQEEGGDLTWEKDVKLKKKYERNRGVEKSRETARSGDTYCIASLIISTRIK